jgi:exoribonuclease R
MRAIADPANALGRGLEAVRQQFRVADEFPSDVLAAADGAARREPTGHVDRTALPFVTLDPARSTDLDQAFMIERSGADLLLHYAIADVAWFVDEGGAIDAEAWQRGTTLYLPDGKAGLYPPVLSEGAVSLLPDGPRPAVIFTVRIGADGEVKLDGAERSIIRSIAKLAYEYVAEAELPEDFSELAARIASAEDRRGAVRVDPPEQEVTALGDGRYELEFRPMSLPEKRNAALSLAANLAIAKALLDHRTGLFRVMGDPDERAIKRLRVTAKAIGLDWPQEISLKEFERWLEQGDPKQAAFMHAVRRAGPPAAYVQYSDGVIPWHSAMEATYVHATAPLRRLADRYVVQAALAVANGRAVPDHVANAFGKLPDVMARADARSRQIGRAVVDLAETVMLDGKEGQSFAALVTDVDERGARMQLCELPVVARVNADGAQRGDKLDVRLVSADPERRELRFERA